MTPFFVDAVGVVGPGMPDWRTAREVLRGERRYEPERILEPGAAMLPPNERRRAAVSVRWALAAAGQAISASSYDAGEVATVFATSGSDGETLHRICEALASPERELSPTRFHNSVHNAAAGYWTIAAASRRASASVCGYDASFTAGLLEAVSQVCAERIAVLLVAYDVPYPPPLQAVRPFTRPFAVALLLAPEPGPRTLACCRVALTSGPPLFGQQPCIPPELASNPAAQSLVLLSMIACDQPGPLQLGYLNGCKLVVEPIAWS